MSIIRITMCAAACLVVSSTFAEEAKAAARPKRVHPTWAERNMGGEVTKPNSAKGKIVIINAQKRVPTADLKSVVTYVENALHPQMALVEASSVKVANPREDIRTAGGNVGVAVVDVPDLPALMTAPEEGWAIVNVAKLADGAKDAPSLAKRVRIEILRGLALSSGCAFMNHDPIVMRMNVLIPEDLDVIKEEGYGVEVKYAMGLGLPYHGVTPWKVTTFKKACEEGWAPAPTNKYQKAIWDKVHALPQNPMKIEFDAKKGR